MLPKIPVYCKEKDKANWVKFPSMLECARVLSLQTSHVSECCSGIRKSHKGYVFRKVSESNNGGR